MSDFDQTFVAAATVVTAEHVRGYENDGVVVVRKAFSADWLRQLESAVEEAMNAPGPRAEEYEPRDGGGRFFGDIELAQRLESFRRFALESPAAELDPFGNAAHTALSFPVLGEDVLVTGAGPIGIMAAAVALNMRPLVSPKRADIVPSCPSPAP